MSGHDANPLLLNPPPRNNPEPTTAFQHQADATEFPPPASGGTRGTDDGVVPRQQRGGSRSHRHGVSGSFLLSDPLQHEAAHDSRSHRRSRNLTDTDHPHHQHNHHHHHRPFSTASRNLETSHSSGAYSEGRGRGLALRSPSPQARARSAHTDGPPTSKRDSFPGRLKSEESTRSSPAPLDMDSTQIVNMALNLSESRRQVGRRNITQSVSPKLAPLPDSAAGGGLRQHLQQQRRVSSGGWMYPNPGLPGRAGTGQRLASPLKATFDAAQEGAYLYRPSQSTLIRVQKAKDHLELAGQYRRLLDLVPPLRPSGAAGRLSTTSRPGSYDGAHAPGANNAAFADSDSTLGREYNPLQYIRNRKVRARERQAIDSEAQGFTDAVRVTEWVDEVATATPSSNSSWAGRSLPPFLTADAVLANRSPSSSSRSSVTGSKPRRPRVDWVIDPADMIADLYWLEQGDHKILVEDRNWVRVFPQDPRLYQPLSHPSGDGEAVDPHEPEVPFDAATIEAKAARGDHEHAPGGTRERAHQKLQALKDLHSHSRHSGLIHRHRRGSVSESSGTESDRRRRPRTRTIGSNDQDVLEKQMMDMIAREQREEKVNHGRDPPTSHPRKSLSNDDIPSGPRSDKVASPTVLRRKKKDSIAEVSEAEGRTSRPKPHITSPRRTGRDSLEVPSSSRRPSLDYDSSIPNSPDLRPVKTNSFVPAIGMDFSPSPSRRNSPTRKPFSKVRGIFHDRNRDRSHSDAHKDQNKDDSPESDAVARKALQERSSRSFERQRSPSPPHKTVSAESDASWKQPHRSRGPFRHRADDSGSGFRGLLRGGPRIDNVLRTGASKVGDLLWRKESEPGDGTSSSSSSSSEPEPEPGKDRAKHDSTPAQSPAQKKKKKQKGRTYLDAMPEFVPASDPHAGKLHDTPTSRPPSRRSSRFERLKPPRINVQSTSPKPLPPAAAGPHPLDSEASDAESFKSGYTDGVRAADARLNAAISLPKHERLAPPVLTNPRWPVSDRKAGPSISQLSRSEIARLRALMLSSGIMAAEIDRRAKRRRLLAGSIPCPQRPQPGGSVADSPTAANPSFAWSSVADLAPDPDARAELTSRPVSQAEAYAAAARVLTASVQKTSQGLQAAAQGFAAETSPALQERAEELRARVRDQSEVTRAAADEADEVSRDLVAGQRLKVKTTVDMIEKLLRRRRRRFRWLRRAGWLALEWVLVGLMWYVWFVVMIARVFLGVGKGVVRGARWLLWL